MLLRTDRVCTGWPASHGDGGARAALRDGRDMAGSQARGIPLFTAGLKLPSRPRTASALESEFALQLRAAGIHAWRREFRFDQYRRWRFDFAWPDQKVAVEIEGGTYTGGRHVRGKGYASDCEKYAEAQLAGWLVIRATREQVKSGKALAWLTRALGG